MVSYLIILFMGKPHGGSLPVLSANLFASNYPLAFFESEKDRIFSIEECAGCKG